MTISVEAQSPVASKAAPVATPFVSVWVWATVTALAALFFPKIEGIRNHGRSAWGLLYFYVPGDTEGLILIPLIVAVTFALFWFLGGWARRDSNGRNRPARVSLVTGLVGLASVVAFWLSAPIILGGLALMLGITGRRLAPAEGRTMEATAGAVLGVLAAAAGAAIWSFIT